jgi:hypothetical protein
VSQGGTLYGKAVQTQLDRTRPGCFLALPPGLRVSPKLLSRPSLTTQSFLTGIWWGHGSRK